MADGTTATPAGNAGVDVQEITKAVTAAVLAAMPAMVTKAVEPIGTQIADLTKANQAITEKVNAFKPGEGLTTDAVAKLVSDQLAANNKAAQDSAANNTARQAMIDKIVTEKLGGRAGFGKLLTGATEQELNAQADAIAAEAKALKPDFAGGSKDGGDASVVTQTTTTTNNNLKGLSPGVAKFAESIKLPGEAPAPASSSATSAAAAAAATAAK